MSSITSTGQVEQAQLRYFDIDGDALLYHFRFLPAESGQQQQFISGQPAG